MNSTRTGTRSALLTDLPVAALLLIGWFTIPTGIVHVVAGVLFVAVAAFHVLTRPRLLSAVRRLRVTTWVVIVSAVIMTVSGFVQWAGVQAMIPVHAGSSGVLIIAAVVHVWQRRRRLKARLTR